MFGMHQHRRQGSSSALQIAIVLSCFIHCHAQALPPVVSYTPTFYSFAVLPTPGVVQVGPLPSPVNACIMRKSTARRTRAVFSQVVWQGLANATYIIQRAATATFSAAVNTTVPSPAPLCLTCSDLTDNPPYVRCGQLLDPVEVSYAAGVLRLVVRTPWAAVTTITG